MTGKPLTPEQMQQLEKPGTGRIQPKGATGTLPPGWDEGKITFWANVIHPTTTVPAGNEVWVTAKLRDLYIGEWTPGGHCAPAVKVRVPKAACSIP